MSLSRKRRRELRRLRAQTQDLLDQQRDVLSHAGSVLHQAGKQARSLSDEHLSPRIGDAIDGIRPAVDQGIGAARRAASNVRRVTTPIVAGALARAVHALEDLESKDTARQLRRFGEDRGLLKRKKSPGGIVAITLGAAAAVGVGYLLWQAFRDDDELWVAPDEDI